MGVYFGKGRQPLFLGIRKMVGGFRAGAGLLGFAGGMVGVRAASGSAVWVQILGRLWVKKTSYFFVF